MPRATSGGTGRIGQPAPRVTCYAGASRLGRWGQVLDEAELAARLHTLTQEHRDLDAAIDALRALPGHDQIQLARLKKRKLRLRDEMAVVQDWLIPDIIA